MIDYRKNFVISLVSYAIQKDIPATELCRLSGIDLEALQSKKPVEIGLMQLGSLWLNALELGGDPLLGLHLGEAMQLSAIGTIGTIIRNSPTIWDALQQYVNFNPLLTDMFDMKVARPGPGNALVIRLIPSRKTGVHPVIQKQTLDLSMALLVHKLDGLLLEKIKPDRVIIPHKRRDRTEYQRVFRCRNVRNGNEYAMEFNSVRCDEPILLANYELQSLLLQYAEKYKWSMNGAGSLSTRITNLLRTNTFLGVPALNEIAANLHMSSRSLQRRLKEEGTTYQELAGAVRKTLAIHYLESSPHQVGEIAYILGFRKLSAFTRAFRGWTGMTPQEYRKGDAPN